MAFQICGKRIEYSINVAWTTVWPFGKRTNSNPTTHHIKKNKFNIDKRTKNKKWSHKIGQYKNVCHINCNELISLMYSGQLKERQVNYGSRTKTGPPLVFCVACKLRMSLTFLHDF